MLKNLIVALTLFIGSISSGQYATVVFEPERNTLNEGLPLPAETRWYLTGPVSERTHIAEARIYDRVDMKKLLYTGRWERTEWNADRRFLIPMDLKLEGNDEYTIVLEFYEPIADAVTDEVSAEMKRYLSGYIDESFEIGRSRARLLKPVKEVMAEMAIIMRDGTSNYRSRLAKPFPGFSQLVEDKLQKINETSLSLSRFSILSDDADEKRDQRIKFAREQMAEVKLIVEHEVDGYFDRELMILRDRTVIADQPTEHVKHIVALNLGFGGVYNSGSLDDLSYSEAPYLGVSFPLGRSLMSSRFMSNSSISAGLFLANLEDDSGAEVTGPLIGRPIYAAYGYKVFRILRLNAGATVLQQANSNANGLDLNKVYLSPFIGLSMEINFWLGLDR
jgi:hypothetical protein